jgi:folylpolyglutamate synthase/dihydropteroate synthase
MTALGFVYFARGVDWAVLGKLGGRLDATNVLRLGLPASPH